MSFYAYGVPTGSSWNGSALSPLPDRSHLLLADTTDGLTLCVVHDAPGDPDGGDAEIKIEIFGDPDGVTCTVEDDGELYSGTPGGSLFTAVYWWDTCCTDGLALSGLDGTWDVLIQFTDVDGNAAPPPIRGLTSWAAYSTSGSPISLALQAGRRVRLSETPAVPQYQTNSFSASLTINGIFGTPWAPAFVPMPGGSTSTIHFSSFNAGLPWDLGYGSAPLIPQSAGAWCTSDGQIWNLDVSDPYFGTWFHGFQGPPFVNFSHSFCWTTPGYSISVQLAVVSPNMPCGVALSQPVRLVVQ